MATGSSGTCYCSMGRPIRYRRLSRWSNSLTTLEAMESGFEFEEPTTSCNGYETDTDLVTLKISLLGDCQIGKTSFVIKYVGDEQENRSLGMAGLNLMEKTLSVRGVRIAFSIMGCWSVIGWYSEATLSWFDGGGRCSYLRIITNGKRGSGKIKSSRYQVLAFQVVWLFPSKYFITSSSGSLVCASTSAMAGHDDSGASEKKSSENEIPTFNAENMQSNMKSMYYSRTFMSIIGGVIAGILGYIGLMGFVVYLFVMAATSIALTAKAGFSIHSYFDSWNRVLLDGFLGGLMSLLLFWTLAYDIVHIF